MAPRWYLEDYTDSGILVRVDAKEVQIAEMLNAYAPKHELTSDVLPTGYPTKHETEMMGIKNALKRGEV